MKTDLKKTMLKTPYEIYKLCEKYPNYVENQQ